MTNQPVVLVNREEAAKVADGWDFGKPIAAEIRQLPPYTTAPAPNRYCGRCGAALGVNELSPCNRCLPPVDAPARCVKCGHEEKWSKNNDGICDFNLTKGRRYNPCKCKCEFTTAPAAAQPVGLLGLTTGL